MSDSKANSYVSYIIQNVGKMILDVKRLYKIAHEFAKSKANERARIEKLKKSGVEITDSMVMHSIKLAYSEDNAMKEIEKIRSAFGKIKLDAYNKREFISLADSALRAKLTKIFDEAEILFSKIDFRR